MDASTLSAARPLKRSLDPDSCDWRSSGKGTRVTGSPNLACHGSLTRQFLLFLPLLIKQRPVIRVQAALQVSSQIAACRPANDLSLKLQSSRESHCSKYFVRVPLAGIQCKTHRSTVAQRAAPSACVHSSLLSASPPDLYQPSHR
jgi:hypothetical protein